MTEDVIENPKHYACEAVEVSYRVEPIELCEQCGFLLGNALKYLFRYQHKGKPLEDLKKAQYYLKRLSNSRGKDGVDTLVWGKHNPIAVAFKDKEFFKYCKSKSIDDYLIEEPLLKFIDEKIAELELQSVEMGK